MMRQRPEDSQSWRNAHQLYSTHSMLASNQLRFAWKLFNFRIVHGSDTIHTKSSSWMVLSRAKSNICVNSEIVMLNVEE